MTKKSIARILLPILLVVGSLPATADQLVYTPVNPTFGGNPNNASGLMAIANAQNDFKAPAIVSPKTPALTPLERFNQNLLNAILAKLNNTSVNNLFDSNGNLTVGNTIRSGNYQISVDQATTADCGGPCPAGSVVLVTQDVSIPGSATRIVIGTN